MFHIKRLRAKMTRLTRELSFGSVNFSDASVNNFRLRKFKIEENWHFIKIIWKSQNTSFFKKCKKKENSRKNKVDFEKHSKFDLFWKTSHFWFFPKFLKLLKCHSSKFGIVETIQMLKNQNFLKKLKIVIWFLDFCSKI